MLSFLLSSYGRTQLKGLHRFVLHFRNDKADFFLILLSSCARSSSYSSAPGLLIQIARKKNWVYVVTKFVHYMIR